MIVEELSASLGLDVDSAGFFRAMLAVEGLKEALKVAGEFVIELGKSLANFVPSVAQAGAEIARAAQRTGTTTDEIQKLSFAAEQSGVSAETLSHSLGLLSRTAYEASQGSAEARQTFASLGVSVYDAGGQIKSTSVLLQDIADHFSRMPDGVKKTALAMRVFSRGGGELIPFLNKGRDGIKELGLEATKYGVVLDRDAIANSLRYEQANHKLTAALTGLKYAIGGPLLEGAGNFATKLAELVAENRRWIASSIVGGVQKLKALVVSIVTPIRNLVKETSILRFALISLGIIASVLAAFKLRGLLLAIQGLTAAEIQWGLASLIAGARAALAGVLAIAPWIALGALVALIADDIIGFFQGQDSFLGTYGARWTKFVDDILNVKPTDNWLVGWLKDALHVVFDLQGAFEKLDAWFHRTDFVDLFLPKKSTEPLGLFMGLGGAAGPSASAANAKSAPSLSPRMNVNLVVNAQPGQDAKQIGLAAVDMMDDWFNAKLAENYVMVQSP